MSKGLEALEELKNDIDNRALLFSDEKIATIENELKRLEEIDNVMFLNNKKLKALEIIKNALGIHLVETFGNKYYIEITGEDIVGLCKENYDLLKEVLC